MGSANGVKGGSGPPSVRGAVPFTGPAMYRAPAIYLAPTIGSLSAAGADDGTAGFRGAVGMTDW
jgi:hypothetical protein